MELSKADVWKLVHAERQLLLDDLADLSGSQWEMSSLCPGWSVHDVLAHIVDAAETGKLSFVWSMVRARGNFDRANDSGIARCRHEDPRQTLAALGAVQASTRTPPAHRATRLVEAIVHGEDIRRPLQIEGHYPLAGVVDALVYQLRTAVSFGGGKERAAGLRLVDSDSGRSWGDGPQVSGSVLDLLLAVSGRPVDPARLTGPGAGRLTEPTHQQGA